MTTRLNRLTQAGCIVLLFMLFPGISLSQEQKGPAAQQPESAGKPAVQDQGAPGNATTPEQQPQGKTEQQNGTALPAAEPAAAEPAAAAPAAEAPVAEPATAPTTTTSQYMIKQGDTLWDISNTFLKDPFLWPFIWKANPGIANPDLIYAGNNIAIPGIAPIERAMEAPEAAPKEVAKEEAAPAEKPAPLEGVASAHAAAPKAAAPEAAPAAPEEATPEESALVAPTERPVPIIDKYSMLSAGFVNNVESSGRIVGAFDPGKTTYGYDDVVYAKIKDKENVNVGDKYLISAVIEKVRHPKTGEPLGRLVRGVGIFEITANDNSSDVVTGRISLSFDAIDKNNILTPYQEPILVYSPGKRAKDISGYIVESTDQHDITGQTDIVYLDRGSFDGVEPGDRFLVYAEPSKKGFPRRKIGEIQVFLVKDRTATAVVRKSSEEIGKGNVVNFEQ